ncbi:MAG TPA: site-specific integrase [Alphaproteobacteria bacterium]|nr:site-specific integrase [Alphaproteobacteria bacterium]
MARRRGNYEGSILRRKDGRWMAQLRIRSDPATGRRIRQTFYGRTRQEVAEQLARAQSDLSRGTYVPPHTITVGAWLDRWLQEYQRPRLRPISYDSYEMLIRVHLKPALGHLALKDLRPDQVQHLYTRKREDGLSARTIRYIHTVLHAALKQALKNGLVVRNVSEATTLPTGKTRAMQPWTIDDVRRFLAAAQDDRLYAAWLVAIGTGMRRGELLGLRWQDLDLEAGVLQVRQELIRVATHDATGSDRKTRLIVQAPKTEQSRRTIPIPADIVEALKHHKARQAEERLLMGAAYEDHGLVFCQANGQPIDPRNFTRHFERMVKLAGVPRIRFHDLRHTFATVLLELGEAPKTVQTLLGHTKISTTLDIYSHVSLDLEKRAAARLGAVLRG